MAAFGCDSGVPGDPKLPDGWDLDKPVTCVRGTARGKGKMPEMLMKLGIAKDLGVGLKLSHSKGTALANSLKGAGWRKANPPKPGGYWLPPPES